MLGIKIFALKLTSCKIMENIFFKIKIYEKS